MSSMSVDVVAPLLSLRPLLADAFRLWRVLILYRSVKSSGYLDTRRHIKADSESYTDFDTQPNADFAATDS